MYPQRFRRPIPLKDWMASKGYTIAKTAKCFADGSNHFIPAAIQKMLANEKRDVGVWRESRNVRNEKLVETKRKKVIGAFVDGQYFDTEEIIYIEELKPGKKLGPNPTADNASKGIHTNDASDRRRVN